MASYRHLARIAVMQTIFEFEFHQKDDLDTNSMLAYNIQQLSSKIKETDFANNTLEGVLKNLSKIRDIIAENAPEWPVEKIAPVDRAILEIGVFEIVYSEDVPPVVAINEAIEIAKVYGDTNSPRFINGVLSSVMTKHKNNAK